MDSGKLVAIAEIHQVELGMERAEGGRGACFYEGVNGSEKVPGL